METGAGIIFNMRQAFILFLLVLLVTKINVTKAQKNFPKYKYHILNEEINEPLVSFLPLNIMNESSISNLDVSPFVNTTNKCFKQVMLLIDGLTSGTMWALKMVDASSKLPSGILIGNLLDMGMYDECIKIQTNEDGEEIRGRHCIYNIFSNIKENVLSQILSICLPATCEPKDVTFIMNEILNKINDKINSDIQISNTGTTCSAIDSTEWTAGGIITIVGFCILLLFLIICTICDIFVRNCNNYFVTNSTFLLLSKFSLYSNAINILTTKTTPQTLPAIQGLRFFSMCWVILGHEYFMSLSPFPINSVDLLKWVFSWNSIYIMIAPFAVDTFFTISGFLMSYLFIKEISKGRKFNIFGYYIHRYLRLTPAFAALLLMTIFIFPRIGSGAIWEIKMDSIEKSCRDNWWTMLLYIHNYVRTDHFDCLGHTWYLAVEMHFFWISPLILYPLAKKPKIGLIILALFFLASIIIPAKISYDEERSSGLVVNNKNVTSMSMDFYVATHNRGSAWLIGIFFGYIFFNNNHQPKKMIKLIGWFVTVATLVFCLFGTRNVQLDGYEYNAVWETFFIAASRPAWSFGIAWIIYACISGFGGPVTKILSLGIFQPFSRISYCMYLVHYIIQQMKISAMRVPRYFSDFILFDYFLSDFVLTVVAGFVFSLVFESPILILEKIILKGNKPKTDALKKIRKNDEQIENGIKNPGLTVN